MDSFKIGRALNNIAISLDCSNFEKVKPYTEEIEQEVLKDEWTLCSDENPEECDLYLVLWNYKEDPHQKPFYEMLEYYVDAFGDGEWDIKIPQASREVEIIAWKPLPEIPKYM